MISAIRAWLKRRRDRDQVVIMALLMVRNIQSPGRAYFGYDLWRHSGLSASRMYEALAQLEGRGEVESQFVDGPYPRRRAYWITDKGKSGVTIERVS